MSTASDQHSILVVDDEDIIREFLFEVLHESYTVSTAVDGQDAIDKIKTGRYDLIITDLKMPKISGEELVRFVRQHEPSSKVIVISGYSTLFSVSQSVDCGANAFLSKPFSIKQLMQTVTSVLSGSETSDGQHTNN
ncbi:MAG: response regulator [Candidatus Zixiibacteriota bacterium]